MKFVEDIKEKIGTHVLERKLRNQDRKPEFYNFDTAKSAGIIFNAMHQQSYITSKGFITSLRKRGMRVRGLGYVANQEAIEYFPMHDGIRFFSIRNNNWFLMPQNPDVQEFIDSNFDLLIDLTLKDLLPIKHIISVTNAKLKLGNNMDCLDLYDFLIDVKENDSLDFFLEQIKHYMDVIKNSSQKSVIS